MTTITPSLSLEPSKTWQARPGWGIAADLTPPEVSGQRQAGRARRVLALALAVVLLACAGAWVLAMHRHSAAESALEDEQTQTLSLRAAASKYAGITIMETATLQIRATIAKLMVSDVDFVHLLRRVHAALPEGMSITDESVSLVPEQVGPTGSADSVTDGFAQVGSITIAGKGQHLTDLAGFVTGLSQLPGVENVIPTSNTKTPHGVIFSVNLELTANVRSHRYDATGATP